MAKKVVPPLDFYLIYYKGLSMMAKHHPERSPEPEIVGKYVRLNLTGEIVEVDSYHPFRVWINYRGQKLEMKRHEITRLTADQQIAHEDSLIRQRPESGPSQNAY